MGRYNYHHNSSKASSPSYDGQLRYESLLGISSLEAKDFTSYSKIVTRHVLLLWKYLTDLRVVFYFYALNTQDTCCHRLLAFFKLLGIAWVLLSSYTNSWPRYLNTSTLSIFFLYALNSLWSIAHPSSDFRTRFSQVFGKHEQSEMVGWGRSRTIQTISMLQNTSHGSNIDVVTHISAPYVSKLVQQQ